MPELLWSRERGRAFHISDSPHHPPKFAPLTVRVNGTGRNRSGYRGNRWNRTGPVPVPVGSIPVKFKILSLNSKNKKISKIPKNTTPCDKCKGVNFFQIFICLVYFA
jgi:hypothetical protein